MEKFAVLNAKMCSIESKFKMFCIQSTKANGRRTLFEAEGKIIQCYMLLCYMMYQKDMLYHTPLYLIWNSQGESLKAQVI